MACVCCEVVQFTEHFLFLLMHMLIFFIMLFVMVLCFMIASIQICALRRVAEMSPSFQTLASISRRFGSQTSSVVKLGAFFPYFDICKSMVTLLNVSSLYSCVEKWNKRVHHNQDTNYVLCFFFFWSVALELRCMSNLW